MDKLTATELPDLIVNNCPFGCDRVCAGIWSNEVTGHRIICKCSCEHKRIASWVEEPEADAIHKFHLRRRVQEDEV
jgi:hypothetical protein